MNRMFAEDCPECERGDHYLCKRGPHSEEECKCVEEEEKNE